jgi:hypothetical protein
MHKVFVVLAAVLLAAIVVQFYLAGVGAFDTAPLEQAFAAHGTLGYGILLYSVLLLIFAAVARLPRRLIGMVGLIASLTLLQGVISVVAHALGGSENVTSTAGQIVFGLHTVNAAVIIAIAVRILRQARQPAAPAPSVMHAEPERQPDS